MPLTSSFFHAIFFFFNDTATTEIYTLSLHDALPISLVRALEAEALDGLVVTSHANIRYLTGFSGSAAVEWLLLDLDRKSTRLNSSHANISYAVFCLKKKKPHNLPGNIPALVTDTKPH